MLLDNNLTSKAPPLHHPAPLPPVSDASQRYDITHSFHQLPVTTSSSITAGLQMTCDKVTHQLATDVEAIMHQMMKYVDDAKHHFRMTIYSLGKHLRDAAVHPQQIYTSDTNPEFPQICYNVSWEIFKTAQTVNFELSKNLDLSGKELMQAARNSARQLGVDIPDYIYNSGHDYRDAAMMTRQSIPQYFVPPSAVPPSTVTESSEIGAAPPSAPLLDIVTEDAEPTEEETDEGCTAVVSETKDAQEQSSADLESVSQLKLPTNEASNTTPTTKIVVEQVIGAAHSQSCRQENKKDIPSNRKKGKHKPQNKSPFSCTECDKVFLHKKSQKLHVMRVHTKERPYQCDVCFKQFVRAYEFNLHKETHLGNPKYKCEQCCKEFFQKSSYEIHIKRRHSDHRQFVCSICKFGFVRRCDLKEHMVIHTDAKQYSCDFCDRAFRREKNLLQHLSIHTGNKQHACKICGEKFVSAYYVRRHMTSHACAAAGQVKCHHCEQLFSKDGIKHHVQTHVLDQSLKCADCGDQLVSTQELLEHHKKHAVDKPFICFNRRCDKRYNNHESLEQHKKSHTLPTRSPATVLHKYVQCDQCGKSVHKARLQSHCNTHSGKKPFKCGKCDKQYYIKKSLQVHMIVKHAGVKRHACQQCSKRFATSNALNKHKLVHNKNRSCTICERAFSSGKSLIEHMAVHTGDKAFRCKLCTEKFARYVHLSKHCKTVHKQLVSGKEIAR